MAARWHQDDPPPAQTHEARDALLQEQWAYAAATIARAFEALRHTPETPHTYAPLFADAHQALREVHEQLRDQPALARQVQHRLLVEGARDGLARAARIERMQARDEGRDRSQGWER